MLKKISCVLFIALLALFALSGCVPELKYKWQGHKWDDMLTLFKHERSMFTEIAEIFCTNDIFHADGSSTARLTSPYDEGKILNDAEEMERAFSESEQKIITDFFEKTRPYDICVDSDIVRITYIEEDMTDTFNLMYFYGDDRDHWLRVADGKYPGMIALGYNWFTHYSKR